MAVETKIGASAPPMSIRDWTLLVLLGAIWGGSFFFARIAVAEIAPLALVMFRVSIAAAVLQLWLLLRGPSFRLAFPLAGSFFVMATLNNIIPFSLIFLGQTELGAGLASVLNATTPFWTAILANMLTQDEKLSAAKITGILFGIAGTAVMIGPGLIAGLGGPIWAKFALIGASISYGFAFIFARRFRGVPPPVVATGQLTASTVVMIPLVLLVHGPAGLFAASFEVWSAVIALAVLATAFAYILYFRIIASAGATNASLVTLIVPMSAILLGTLFLGERLEVFEIAGMALIGLGLVTIDGRLFAAAPKPFGRSHVNRM
ncbi:DMT family transporter [Nitratireductor sp. GCM10026969]|uniref:DMT family transporter n=1 Tax=Nitratireductor sp. GCM10026969 TaxID=3252645 RepID=UPI00360A64F7